MIWVGQLGFIDTFKPWCGKRGTKAAFRGPRWHTPVQKLGKPPPPGGSLSPTFIQVFSGLYSSLSIFQRNFETRGFKRTAKKKHLQKDRETGV